MATVGRFSRLSAYAALVRVPNLFTAPPDVVLGAALASAMGQSVPVVDVGLLAVSSMVLYAGGTTLNDAVDAPTDAIERPERPIPKGHVSRRAAFGLAGGLLAVAILVALLVSPLAGGAATLVAVAIVAYDALLDGVLGPIGMGTTRGLNVVLGTTAGGVLALDLPVLLVPVVTAIYIAAVTAMAAHEAVGGTRPTIVLAGSGVAVATLGVLGLLFVGDPPLERTILAGVLLGGFVAWTGRSLAAAYDDPDPSTVGGAVGRCVLALVVLDAAFAAVVGVDWALAALVFLVPAVTLSAVFDVS